jgi:hypothetical protein
LKQRHDKHGEQHQVTPTLSSTVVTQPFVLNHKVAPVSNPTTASASNVELAVCMSSLRNKNKKKGFRNSMTRPSPQKIIFSTESETSVTDCVLSPKPMTSVVGSAVLVSQTSDGGQPRLITPSEKQSRGELPVNVFVTTVDLEEGLHSKKPIRCSKARRLLDGEQGGVAGVNIGHGSPSDDEGSKRRTDRDISPRTAWENVPQLDLDQAGRDWESSAEITTLSQLRPGKIVGWKVLLFVKIHSNHSLMNLVDIGVNHSSYNSYARNIAYCCSCPQM